MKICLKRQRWPVILSQCVAINLDKNLFAAFSVSLIHVAPLPTCLATPTLFAANHSLAVANSFALNSTFVVEHVTNDHPQNHPLIAILVAELRQATRIERKIQLIEMQTSAARRALP